MCSSTVHDLSMHGNQLLFIDIFRFCMTMWKLVHTLNNVLMARKLGFAFCAEYKIHILWTDVSQSYNSHFISELWYFELITRPHFTSPALTLSKSCLVCKEHMSRQTNQNHIVKRIFQGLVIFPLPHSICFQVTVSFGTLPLVVIFARTPLMLNDISLI